MMTMIQYNDIEGVAEFIWSKFGSDKLMKYEDGASYGVSSTTEYKEGNVLPLR
jgi:hypothetical protein